MRLFRLSFIREILILLAGVTFLNMGFILAEVSAFNLSKYSKLAEDVTNSGFEDEGGNGTESQTGDSVEEEIDLMDHHYFDHHLSVFFVSLEPNRSFVDLIIDSNYLETFSPPPEILSSQV